MMNILCKLKLHRWKYKNWYYAEFPLIAHLTRYCERCEKIEKALGSLSSIYPPIWESVIPKEVKNDSKTN